MAFTADPASWTRGGHGVIGVGVDCGVRLDGLCGRLSAAGACWGCDDIGRAFFDGDGPGAPGYGTSRDQALAAAADVVNCLQVGGAMMVAVANNYVSADEASDILKATVGSGAGVPDIRGVPEISWYQLKPPDYPQVESDPPPSAVTWMFDLFSTLSLNVQIPDGSIAGLGQIRDALNDIGSHISRVVIPDVQGFTRQVALDNNGDAAAGFASFVTTLTDELSWLEKVFVALAESADSARSQKVATWIQAALSAAFLIVFFAVAQVMAVWSGPAAQVGFWEAVRGEATSMKLLYAVCRKNVLLKAVVVGGLFGMGMDAARQGGLILAGLQRGFDVVALAKATGLGAFAGALMGAAGRGVEAAGRRKWAMFEELAAAMSRSGAAGRASRLGFNAAVGTLANAGSEELFDGKVDWGQAVLDGAGMALLGEAVEPVTGAAGERIRRALDPSGARERAKSADPAASGTARDPAAKAPADPADSVVVASAAQHARAMVGYHEAMAERHEAMASEAFGRLRGRAAGSVVGVEAHTPDAYGDPGYAENADRARYHREQAELWRQRLTDAPATPGPEREHRTFGFVHYGAGKSGGAVTYVDVVGDEHARAMDAYLVGAHAAGVTPPFTKIVEGHYVFVAEPARGGLPDPREGVLHAALGYAGAHDGLVPLLQGVNDGYDRPERGSLRFGVNELTPRDFAEIRDGFEAAAPAFERLGLADLHEIALRRIDAMARKAWGERAGAIRQAMTKNVHGHPIAGYGLLDAQPDRIRASLDRTLTVEGAGLRSVVSGVTTDRSRMTVNVLLDFFDVSGNHAGGAEFHVYVDAYLRGTTVADIVAFHAGWGRSDPAVITFGRDILTRIDNWLIAHDVDSLRVTNDAISGYSISALMWDSTFQLDAYSRRRISDHIGDLAAAGKIAPESVAAWERIEGTAFRATDVAEIGYANRRTGSDGVASWDGLKMLDAFHEAAPMGLWKRLAPIEMEDGAERGIALDPRVINRVGALTANPGVVFTPWVEQLARIIGTGDSAPAAADLVRAHYLAQVFGFRLDYGDPRGSVLPYPDVFADRVRRVLRMTERPTRDEVEALGLLVDGMRKGGWTSPEPSGPADIAARLQKEAADFLHREPSPQVLRELLRPGNIEQYRRAHDVENPHEGGGLQAIRRTLPTKVGIGDPGTFLQRAVSHGIYPDYVAEWLRSTIGFRHPATGVRADVVGTVVDPGGLRFLVKFSRTDGTSAGEASISVQSTGDNQPLRVEITKYHNEAGPAFGRDFLGRVQNWLVGQHVFKVDLVIDGKRSRPVRAALQDAAEAGFALHSHDDITELNSHFRKRMRAMAAAGSLGRAGESDWNRLEPRTEPKSPPSLGELYGIGRAEPGYGPDGELTWPGKELLADFPGFRHDVRLTARLTYPDR